MFILPQFWNLELSVRGDSRAVFSLKSPGKDPTLVAVALLVALGNPRQSLAGGQVAQISVCVLHTCLPYVSVFQYPNYFLFIILTAIVDLGPTLIQCN